MDTFELVRNKDIIDFGQVFLDSLGNRKDRFPIALWMKLNEDEEWTLVIASKDYREHGPLNIYKSFIDILKSNHIPLKIANMTLIDSKSKFATEIRAYRGSAGAFYKDHPGSMLLGGKVYPVLKIYHIF